MAKPYPARPAAKRTKRLNRKMRHREYPLICRIIGSHLSQIRQIPHRQVADLVGVDRSYPYLLETGRRAPTMPMFIRYVRRQGADPVKAMKAILRDLDKAGLVQQP